MIERVSDRETVVSYLDMIVSGVGRFRLGGNTQLEKCIAES